jgi:hypothetical protein
MHSGLVLHRPIDCRNNGTEFLLEFAIKNFIATVRIEPNDIDIANRWLWGSAVESIPNGVSDEPGCNPAVWQIQMGHHFQKSPSCRIATEDSIQL